MSNRFLPILITTAAAFLVFVLLVPQYDRIKLTRGAIDSQGKTLAQKQAISDSIKKLNQGINDQRADINKLNELIPDKKNIPELISNLVSIAGQAGLGLSELNFSETQEPEALYKSILADLKLSGNYLGAKNLLSLIEQSQRLIDVTRVEINQSPGTSLLSIAVKLKAFQVDLK